MVLLPNADQLLSRLSSMIEDRSLKARRRLEAQQCHAALLSAVGEYIESRQQRHVTVRVELLGQPDYGLQLGDELAAEALIPYASQAGIYPEHLYSL